MHPVGCYGLRRSFMDTFWGSLVHLFTIANKEHMLWCIGILVVMIVLAILHHVWRGHDNKIKIWRWLCLLPFLVCVVHFLIYCLPVPMLFTSFISMYLIGLLALLPMITAKRRIGHRVIATIVGILTGVFGIYFCLSAPQVYNFARQSYMQAFHSAVITMDKTYVLKEWKEVDFDALEAKYMPMVQEAEAAQDPAKYYDAVKSFFCELHDGHVGGMYFYDDETYKSTYQQHEYGLAMVQLDNGDVIAVCTDDAVHKFGIEDGTVITKWNGKPVLQAAEEDVAFHSAPVKANDDRISLFNLSSVGGDTVEITFLDKSGKEKTETLSDLGEMHTFGEAFSAFTQEPEYESQEEYMAYYGENFSTKMLDDKVGYLVLREEATDNGVQDILGYMTGNHKWAREMFREKLCDLKAQGMEYLVIDLRNNGGGLDEIATALCDLLTDQDYTGQNLGIRKNGAYQIVSEHGIHGDGEFADLQVVALTNFECLSAGDGAALYLSKLPNVTLAGITDPCGCNMETGGNIFLSGGTIVISYPIGLVLDGNNEPNIDTRADRISRNPVEERIPLDYDAAMKIFCDKQDYELDWAVAYLKEK